MTLVVEDGTGLSNAESYISVADATSYHAGLGNTAWASLASDTVREQLLRKATNYMISAYRSRWAGTRTTSTQALDWPRYGVPMVDVSYMAVQYVPSNQVPIQVIKACADLALKAISGDLMADSTRATVREKIDALEVEYDRYSPQQTKYSQIDGLLSVFFKSSSNTVRLER